MDDSNTPIVTNAYAVVPGGDDKERPTTTAFVTAETVELHQPAVLHRSEYHLPEARNLTWEDDFFEQEGEDGIVAVFDLDYEQMETYYESLSWTGYAFTCLCPNVFWTISLLGAPCFLRKNVQWAVRSQHVAITRDGVRFVKERRPTCWGLACSDAGKISKTVRDRLWPVSVWIRKQPPA